MTSLLDEAEGAFDGLSPENKPVNKQVVNLILAYQSSTVDYYSCPICNTETGQPTAHMKRYHPEIKEWRLGTIMDKHTQGSDMADERPDDPQKPLKSVQSPPQEAGALRTQLSRLIIENRNERGLIDDVGQLGILNEVLDVFSTAVDGITPAAEEIHLGDNKSFEYVTGWNACRAEFQRRRKELLG